MATFLVCTAYIIKKSFTCSQNAVAKWTTIKPPQKTFFNAEEHQLPQGDGAQTFLYGWASQPIEEAHLSCLYPLSRSFGHNSDLLTLDGWNIAGWVNWEICLLSQFLYQNYLEQHHHYCRWSLGPFSRLFRHQWQTRLPGTRTSPVLYWRDYFTSYWSRTVDFKVFSHPSHSILKSELVQCKRKYIILMPTELHHQHTVEIRRERCLIWQPWTPPHEQTTRQTRKLSFVLRMWTHLLIKL